MNLFQKRDVKLHSGAKSDWIIDCNRLEDDDLDALALIGARMVPDFGLVMGIPRGGLRFAEALTQYAVPTSDMLLIADDVCTTGNSFEDFRSTLDLRDPVPGSSNVPSVMGMVMFARGPVPSWVIPIWTLGPRCK